MCENICILLGAGATAEQELPLWIDLVKGVTDYYKIDLNINKDNLVESIGVVEDALFVNIQEKLEKTNSKFNTNECQFWARRQIALATKMCLKKNLINQNLESVKSKTNLMQKIVESVFKRVEKNLMTTIITYNFDDYFEFSFKRHLKDKGKLSEYSKYLQSYTIGEANQHLPSGTQEKLVNVYHVHGMIPIFDELFGYELTGENQIKYKKNNLDLYQKYLDKGIVFSGNDYNVLIDDSIVGWTNMIQYICYSQLPVSIIGFSLTDANFRVLIRRMKKSKEKMKSVMLFLGYSKDKLEEKKIAESSVCTANYLLKDINQYNEHKICEFINEMPIAVQQHLDSMLN